MDKEAKRVRSSEGRGYIPIAKAKVSSAAILRGMHRIPSELKPRKARIVLGWVTAREVLRVLLAFCITYS